MKHCCRELENHLFCVEDTAESSDENRILYFSSRFREYGIPIHNHGISSYIEIAHCPWCGKRFPGSLREQWFDTLEKLGYDAPLEQEIPLRFRNEEWYESADPK